MLLLCMPAGCTRMLCTGVGYVVHLRVHRTVVRGVTPFLYEYIPILCTTFPKK